MRRIRLSSIHLPPIRGGGDGMVNARPEIVWDILTDYRNGQPQLFPMFYRRVVIEEGGKGAGTVRLFLPVSAGASPVRTRVSTPEPGRVLHETNDHGGSTIYTLMPVDSGAHTHVKVLTIHDAGAGMRGAVAWPFMLLIRAFGRINFALFRDKLDDLARTWKTPASESI